MSKDTKPKTIEVKEKVKIKIGNKEYEFEANSPTSGFYTDLYDEITFGSDVGVVSPLTKAQVLDSAGNVGAEILASNWSWYVEPPTIGFSGSSTWNSDNPPATLKVIAGEGKVYFQTALPSGISAQKGLPITVTWQATFSVNIPSVTGYLAGASLVDTSLITRLVYILADTRENKYLAIRKIVYYYSDGYQWELTPTCETGIRHIYIPATTVTRSGTITHVLLATSSYEGLRFMLSSPLNVSVGDYISLDIYFT